MIVESSQWTFGGSSYPPFLDENLHTYRALLLAIRPFPSQAWLHGFVLLPLQFLEIHHHERTSRYTTLVQLDEPYDFEVVSRQPRH